MWRRDYTQPGHIEKKALEIGKRRRKERLDKLAARNEKLQRKVNNYRKLFGAGGAAALTAAYLGSGNLEDTQQQPQTQNRPAIVQEAEPHVQTWQNPTYGSFGNPNTPRGRAEILAQPQVQEQRPFIIEERIPEDNERSFGMPVMKSNFRSSMPNFNHPS